MRKQLFAGLLLVVISTASGAKPRSDDDDEEDSRPPHSSSPSFRSPYGMFGGDSMWSPYLNYFPFSGFGGTRSGYRPYMPMSFYGQSPYSSHSHGSSSYTKGRSLGSPTSSLANEFNPYYPTNSGYSGNYMSPFYHPGVGSYRRPPIGQGYPPLPYSPYGNSYRAKPSSSKKEKDSFEEMIKKLGINLADFGLEEKKEKKPEYPMASAPINPITANPLPPLSSVPTMNNYANGGTYPINYGNPKQNGIRTAASGEGMKDSFDNDLANLGIDLNKFGFSTTRSPLDQLINSAYNNGVNSGYSPPLMNGGTRGVDSFNKDPEVQLNELTKLLTQLNGGNSNQGPFSANTFSQQLNQLRELQNLNKPSNSLYPGNNPSAGRTVMPLFTNDDSGYFRPPQENPHLQNFKPFTGKATSIRTPANGHNYFRNTEIFPKSNDDFFFNGGRKKEKDIFDLNSDSKAYKYFESVRKEKEGEENGGTNGNRYRGFRPILNYRPGSRIRNSENLSTSTQGKNRDEEQERPSRPEEDTVTRLPGRSKPTYSEDDSDQSRFDSKRKIGNKNYRVPAHTTGHDESEYDDGPEEGGQGSDPSRPRKPSLQSSFDYEGDIDEDNPFADRLKTSQKRERESSKSSSSSSSSSKSEASSSDSNSSKEDEENGNHTQNRRSDDENKEVTFTTTGKSENGKKVGDNEYRRRNGKSIQSDYDGSGRQLSLPDKKKSQKQSSRNQLAEQVVGLLGLEFDEEDAKYRSLPARNLQPKFDDDDDEHLENLFKRDSFFSSSKHKPNKKWNLFEAQKRHDDQKSDQKMFKNKKCAKSKKSTMDRVYDEDNTDHYGKKSKYPIYKKYQTINK